MSADAPAMAAIPGETASWPAAPQTDGVRPAAEPRSAPRAEPVPGYGVGPAPEFTAEPVPGYGAGPVPGHGVGTAPEFDTEPAPRVQAEPASAAVVRPAGRRSSPAVRRADALTGQVARTERAVIGDKLRAPGVWCELTPCISHRIDPAALGEADVRERAIAAGWRFDALGRLACPECQQTDTRFRGTQAVMRWERDAAITMASLMVAGFHERQSGVTGFADETAVIPVFPAAVIPPGSSQDAGPPIRDAWAPS